MPSSGVTGLRLENALSVLLGAGFTLGLFLGIAHLENIGPAPVDSAIEDLHAVSIPFEMPPPKVTPQTEESMEPPSPLAGLELGDAGSPVKISVLPPDLESFVTESRVPPSATIRLAQLETRFKPQIGVSADFQRIYQTNEVDKIPTVLNRVTPNVPRRLRGDASSLRVVLILILDTQGTVTSIRVSQTSGNAEFDAIVGQCLNSEWTFTPAMKNGRRVRCLLQQAVTIRFQSNSRFTL